MQRISRAPVLSATRRRDSCWITGDPPGDGLASLVPGCSPGLLQHLDEMPVLLLRDRPGLDDPDAVADLRRVLLVMGVELGRAPDDLLVLRMRLHRVDLDDDRLVHR